MLLGFKNFTKGQDSFAKKCYSHLYSAKHVEFFARPFG